MNVSVLKRERTWWNMKRYFCGKGMAKRKQEIRTLDALLCFCGGFACLFWFLWLRRADAGRIHCFSVLGSFTSDFATLKWSILFVVFEAWKLGLQMTSAPVTVEVGCFSAWWTVNLVAGILKASKGKESNSKNHPKMGHKFVVKTCQLTLRNISSYHRLP